MTRWWLMVLAMLSGCASLSWATVESDVVNCGDAQLAAGILTATPIVTSALTGASNAEWEGDLEFEVAAVGIATVECAVSKVVAQLEAAPGGRFRGSAQSSVAIIRGEVYLHSPQISGHTLTVHRIRR